jgi:hypothetical protein
MREPTESPPEKNETAAELGRRGGLKGGLARAANMTPEARKEAARLAAEARWARIRAAGETLEKPNPDRGLFVFTLEPDEAAYITQTTIAGRGGLQSLQRKLQDQLSQGSTVRFDNAGLGQLIRYMTQYRDGGFQGRLRNAFERSLRQLLDL